MSLYLCIHLRDFATLALTAFEQLHKENARRVAQRRDHQTVTASATAVLAGEPPLERVFAVNSDARDLGVACGMSRPQAESFPALLLRRDLHQEQLAFTALMRCAERFSPRIQILAAPQAESCGATLLLDISDSRRLLGSPPQIASAVQRAICEAAYEVAHVHSQPQANVGTRLCAVCNSISVAVAQNGSAAVLAARGLPGSTVIAPGREAASLAPLPVSVLEASEEQAETLAGWGIGTLGQLAALEPRGLAARLGQSGLRLQRQARGDDDHLLVPEEQPADAPLHAELELEVPVELLEPLLFLLNQLLEQVMARAAERALALASVEVTLVTTSGSPKPAIGLQADAARQPVPGATEVRTIRPALPERDRHALLKLIQLELETHPPASAVTALRMVSRLAPPQNTQQGLFAAQAPEPGRLEILLARIRKLAGENRVGSPELLDSRAPEAFRMTRFAPEHNPIDIRHKTRAPGRPVFAISNCRGLYSPALRMMRPPRAVQVELRDGAPIVLRDEAQQRIVQASSGPWRTSGGWWVHPGWCREEWDICVSNDPANEAEQATGRSSAMHRDELPHASSDSLSGHAVRAADLIAAKQQAMPCCLRVAYDPASSGWYVIGIYD